VPRGPLGDAILIPPDPSMVAYELAMAGLSDAFREEDGRRALAHFAEYEILQRHDSVSGVGHRGESDDGRQLGFEWTERRLETTL